MKWSLIAAGFGIALILVVSHVFHFAEFLYFVDIHCEKQHQVFLLEFHDVSVHLLVQPDVWVNQDWYLASFFSQIVNYFGHCCLTMLHLLISMSTRVKLDHDSKLIVCDCSLQCGLQLEQTFQELLEPLVAFKLNWLDLCTARFILWIILYMIVILIPVWWASVLFVQSFISEWHELDALVFKEDFVVVCQVCGRQ